MEDAHWIDKISEEFFTFFSRCIPEHPIMLLSAYRPEGAPPWAQGIHYQRLGLETLSSESSVHLVHNILGGLHLEPALEQRIVEKTKGNPFFVEEIVRELLERGDISKSGNRYVSNRSTDQLQIPNTFQAVLAARMDRLSEDLKRTMQVASVIGRDFAYKILKTILELGDDLREHLTNLVGLEILYEKALFGHRTKRAWMYRQSMTNWRNVPNGRARIPINQMTGGAGQIRKKIAVFRKQVVSALGEYSDKQVKTSSMSDQPIVSKNSAPCREENPGYLYVATLEAIDPSTMSSLLFGHHCLGKVYNI